MSKIETKMRGWTIPKPKPKPKPKPNTEWLLERCKTYGCGFAIRFWPSKKGWRVLDARQAQSFQVGGQKYSTWSGYRFLNTIFPSEDAAVMAAISLA